MKKEILAVGMLVAIAIIISLQSVLAQRYGCCYKTFDGRYCEEGYENVHCDTANFLGGNCTDSRNAGKCGLITCALPKGCMLNVNKGKCLYEYEGTMAIGDECQKGCCGIAGRSYGIIEKKVCKNIAFEKGFNESYIEFSTQIQDEHACAAKFEPTVKGCCITAEGCKDTTRQECKGEFHADILCKAIPTRCQVTEIGLRCGKQPGNAEKVVLLDSAGGEEVKYSCSLPQYRCIECGNATCELTAEEKKVNPNRNKVEQFEGYCADTSCKLEGIGKQQSVTPEGKIEAANVITKTLQTGQSICYNFYGVSWGGKGIDKENVGSSSVVYMHGRSTGLQNHVLVCNYGKIEVVGLGDDRKTLCKDDPSVYVAKKIKNIESPTTCTDCGTLKGGWLQTILNPIGDFVSAGWITGGLLGRWISEQCGHEKCAKIKSAEGEQLCFFSQKALRGWGANPVGSCVPRYPLGESTSCASCGGGGDFIWNWLACKEEECYSLGNCQFRYDSPLIGISKFGLSFIAFYGVNRLGGLPVETLTRTLDKCLLQEEYMAKYAECVVAYQVCCIAGELIPSFGQSFADAFKEPVKKAWTGLKGVGGVGGWFWDQLWSKGEQIVKEKATEAITKITKTKK